VLIVKVGGGDLDLDAIATDLASLDRPFVLLHGANKLRDTVATALGNPTRVVESVSGYTSVLTDERAIDALLAAYAGIRNKRLVEALRKAGVNALGLTGLDGGLVRGERGPGIRTVQEGRKLLLRDLSGKPRHVDGRLLRTLLSEGYAPVVTVPIVGEDGTALNTENDDVLALLAAELRATDVVSLIEAPGLLSDGGDPSTVVHELEADELEAWEGRVEGRMRRKLRALRTLFELAPQPGPVVRIADGRTERPVSDALAGAGTRVARSPARAPAGISGDLVDPPGESVPDSSSASWLERQGAHELDPYGKRGLALVHGAGSTVRDVEGRAYIDCVGGHGALALGHRHPALVAALADEAERVWFVPGSYGSPARARLLERLHQALPDQLDRTFLSNSGAEAVECALKIARLHTGRGTFVTALRGFHGRTMGALSVTAEARYREPFEPLLAGVRRVPYNDPHALREAVDADVAAVILEPVQGEGGVHVADPGYLRTVREACDAAGALLVLDEVQTGFGRTGRMFAFESAGVVPDILCLAKSIAGGLPLGATVVRRGIGLPMGVHGSTFGGNPLACAAARATLDVLLGTDLLDGVEPKGRRLEARLAEAGLPVVREVRRVGLMVGIQLRLPVRPYLARLQQEGVLALAAGSTVLRLLPPLVITDEEIDYVADALLRVLADAPEVRPTAPAHAVAPCAFPDNP
jgi:acetylornithine/LysW-gamma-L-lysine aminotransferase